MIPFKCLQRADLVSERIAAALKVAGCKTVWIGAESGSQKILDAMDKGDKVADIYRATRLLHVQDIEVGFFLQFGYPGENWNDIQRTLQMVRECMPDDIGISVSYPLPGTKFFERVKLELDDKQNWIDSEDLAMLYRGPIPPSFIVSCMDACITNFVCVALGKGANGTNSSAHRIIYLELRAEKYSCEHTIIERATMIFPIFPETVQIPEMVTAEAMLEFRRKYSGLDHLQAPRGLVLCLYNGLMNRFAWRYPSRHITSFQCDLHLLKRTGSKVGAAGNFGMGAPAIAALAEQMIAWGTKRSSSCRSLAACSPIWSPAVSYYAIARCATREHLIIIYRLPGRWT